MGGFVLLGWAVDNSSLKSLLPGATPMMPNTALAFALSGVALLFLRLREQTVFTRWAARLCSAIVILIGLTTGGEYLSGGDFGIDRWLILESAGGMGSPFPGRMGMNTSLCFMLFGLALWLATVSAHGAKRAEQWLTLVGLFIAFMALLGYAYHVEFLSGPARYTQMSLHASMGLLILGFGILSLNPADGPLVTLLGGHLGSRMARRLLPTTMMIPPLVGWALLTSEQAGLVDPTLGTAVAVAINVVFLWSVLFWTARSINEADQARRQSDRLFASFMSHLPALAWIKDVQGRYVYLNEAFQKAFEVRLDDWRGKTDRDVLPSAIATQFQANDAQVIATKRPLLTAETAPHRDGPHESLVSKFPIVDEEGILRLVGGVAVDMTERRQVETALREREEQFRQVTEHIQEVFWLSDTAKNAILYISPGYETIWGRSCESLYASPRSWLEAIHPEDRARILQAAVTKQTTGAYDEEYRIVRPDGSIRWIRDRAFPIRNEEGQIFRVAGVATDVTAQKLAEQALQQANEQLERRVEERTAALTDSQQRLEVAMTGASLASWDWNIETGAVAFNKLWARIRGLSPDEVVPHVSFWREGVHPEDRPLVEQQLNACLAGQTAEYEAEMRVRTSAGEWRWVLDRGRVIERNAEGAPRRMAGIEIDITARKRDEEALRQAQAFIMSVVENLPNMIFVKDAKDLRFVELNKAGEELLGCRRDELLGKNDHDFFPPDEADSFTRKDREVLASGRMLDIPSEPIQTRRRGLRILHTKKIPLYDETGKPRYLLGISEDITERKLVEEALRASEERYSSLVSQATDIIYTAGTDGRFTFVNAAACALMEYQEQELLGKHYLELIRPDCREAAQRFYKQQLIERIPSTYFEFPALTKSGREVWFGQHVQLRLVDGQVVGIEAITRDITARKQSERILEERAKCAAFAAEVSLLLNRDEPLDRQLQRCTDAAVTHLGAAFTRIWLREPGDLCADCHKVSWCRDHTECLHLHASSGLSANLNGEYRRIPMGALKIGRIAQGDGPLFTNDAVHDDRLPNKTWIQENGLRSFAGFPLIVDGRIFGVLAVFSREVMSEALRQTIESVCNGLATAIARKQAERELQDAYDRLREVTRQLVEAEEGERRRIACELHDEFGQALTGLKFDVAWLTRQLSSISPGDQRAVLASKTMAMSRVVDGLIQTVRETAAALRPSVLDDLGLVAAVEWLVASFRDRTGLPCELRIDPYIQGLSVESHVATTVFRGAQELLTNVMRHAQASTLSVELSIEGDRLSLKVCDDGRGIQEREWKRPGSLGLRGLYERVAAVGGTVVITGTPGAGTEATLLLPLHLAVEQVTKEPT